MSEVVLEADGVVAVLDTMGGRLSQLTVRRHDLLVPFTDRWTLSGCYPMVPWAGRLDRGRFAFEGTEYQVPITMDPHAIHGVGARVDWELVGDGRMRIDLADGWQLGGTAETSYVLDGSSITCSVAVTATDQAMPAVIGFHPCFVRDLDGHADALSFVPGFMWERAGDHLPTGVRLRPPPPGPWDDCFGGVAEAPRLTWGDVLAVELRSATDTWVAFDQLDVAICVEPQTEPPNAFNMGGGAVLQPGESLALTLEIAWETPV
ncbi:MAG: aldose 1-epimerase [Actinomycetota bacterium]